MKKYFNKLLYKMNNNYEQLSVDSHENASGSFSHKKPQNKFSDIIRTKNNKCGKYIIPLIMIIVFVLLFIFKNSKEKKLEIIKLENLSFKEQIESLKAQEHDYNQIYKQLNTEKQTLIKQTDDLSKSVEQYKEKIDKLEKTSSDNKNVINDLASQLQQVEDKLQNVIQDNDGIKKKLETIEEDEYAEDIDNLNEKIKNLKDKIAKIKGRANEENEYNNENEESLNIDSQIITMQKEISLLKRWLNKSSNYRFELLYRATKHGYSNEKFKQYVGDSKHTVVLLKDRKTSAVIGGYTSQSWEGEGFKEDSQAFVFNLSTQSVYYIRDIEYAIYCSPKYLAVFGRGDIVTANNEAYTSFPASYGTGKENHNLLGQTDNSILLLEMEVFRLIPN
jgi:prefoldin subunit 5